MRNVVSHAQWQAALQEFREKEKEHTRRQDQLNADRRRLPMVKLEKSYAFTGAAGRISLPDLFAGRRQLIVYHFMFAPEAEVGCTGCSMVIDNVGNLAHIEARDTSFVMIALAPYPRLQAFQKRMGWTIPWYSSYGSEFNVDMGVTTDKGETHGVSVFLRDGETIYHSYFTTMRGVEHLGSNWSWLDLTPLGRQELWEESPGDVEQTAPYQWWRLHDSYA